MLRLDVVGVVTGHAPTKHTGHQVCVAREQHAQSFALGPLLGADQANGGKATSPMLAEPPEPIVDHPHIVAQHRPHSAHGELTPSEFATAWTTRYQPARA